MLIAVRLDSRDGPTNSNMILPSVDRRSIRTRSATLDDIRFANRNHADRLVYEVSELDMPYTCTWCNEPQSSLRDYWKHIQANHQPRVSQPVPTLMTSSKYSLGYCGHCGLLLDIGKRHSRRLLII